ncbi:ead/Ea22-like family protein [Escherichia coli]|uniref:ead/Ea22-like family protein n=1 Tax=Escherichia coli TaxID=562 RepID=UPI00191B87C3|nr:ead/Ea22-like family protein [Escherichia coli]MDL4640777.1 ead/Ea22-like family protein [Escherichia coli]MEC5666139.1 ead/Ea22-like family protein [Escherichia coli]MEC5708027.1 ead/Ea22-like family protein [Escherichia coli]MEC6040695.1 ead/Ea22-like family protein [Escherichia coli]HBH9818159.1 ead/Ea22-like family protein [Escherichia coli]
MSNINKQALRETVDAANKASWGRWESYHPHKGARGHEVKVGVKAIAQHCLKVDAEFIAASNPATVLALLDELETKDKRNAELEDLLEAEIKSWMQRYDSANNRREAAEKRNAKLQSENAYIRNRFKELDLLIGKNILVMQAAIIEWQATGDAKSGLAWIYNTLFGPGELPDESEKDAQAYFDRKYAPIDEELMALHKWFWEQSEAERAAAGIGVKGE